MSTELDARNNLIVVRVDPRSPFSRDVSELMKPQEAKGGVSTIKDLCCISACSFDERTTNNEHHQSIQNHIRQRSQAINKPANKNTAMALFGLPDLQIGEPTEEEKAAFDYPLDFCVPKIAEYCPFTFKRECFDWDCHHKDCRMANRTNMAKWFAPERMKQDAVFDPKLTYPMSPKYLRKRIPREQQYPTPLFGRNFPEGTGAQPNSKEAKIFILSHPNLIMFLFDRAIFRLRAEGALQEVYKQNIRTDLVGPCWIVSEKNKMETWMGVTVNLLTYRLAALVNDITTDHYTVERALAFRMDGSRRCLDNNCVNPKHLLWEWKWLGQQRGSDKSHLCKGTLKIKQADGTYKLVPVCRHGRSLNYDMCVTISLSEPAN